MPNDYTFGPEGRVQLTDAEQAIEDANRTANANAPREFEGPTFVHSGQTFEVTTSTIARANALAVRKGNGRNLVSEKFRDVDGVPYSFTGNADFEAFYDAAYGAYTAAAFPA